MNAPIGAVNHAKEAKMIPPQPIVFDLLGSEMEIEACKKAMTSYDYINAPNFCTQIGVLCNALRTPHFTVSYARIGTMFMRSGHCIRDQHQNFLRGPSKDGRPCMLTDHELDLLEEYILSLHTRSPYPLYPTTSDLLDFIDENFSKYLSSDTLRKIIYLKFNSKFKTCDGYKMDSKRLEANINDIEDNLNHLKELVEGVPMDFIYNLDEVGIQEWADSEQKTVIVPANYEKASAPYEVNRNSKRSSILVCVSPNGLVGVPQYCVQRKTIDSELYRYLSKETLQIVNTESGFINTNSFAHWLNTVFYPHVQNLRKLYSYNGPAILIMDGYKAHELAIKEQDLVDNNIKVHYLVPHSSDQLQPLDIGVFGCMKRFMSNYKRKDDVSELTNQIIRAHGALLSAAPTVYCHSAFKAIGIVSKYVYSQGPLYEFATFDILMCSKVRAYQTSHILELAQTNSYMTPNQKYILNQCHRTHLLPTSRIPIESFPTLRNNQ